MMHLFYGHIDDILMTFQNQMWNFYLFETNRYYKKTSVNVPFLLMAEIMLLCMVSPLNVYNINNRKNVFNFQENS